MNANLYSHFMFDTKKQNPLILLDDGKTFTYEDVDQKVAQFVRLKSPPVVPVEPLTEPQQETAETQNNPEEVQ